MDVLGAFVVGLSSGALFAVIGVILTLMATLTRVINFAQVAVGVFGAFLALKLVPLGGPKWQATVIAVLVAAALSALIGWIISTWLGEASTTVRSAVTVAALLGLIAISDLVFGTQPQPVLPLLIGPAFSIGVISVTKVGIALLALAIMIAVVAKLLLAKTSLGVRLRAIADRQTAAELLGVNVTALQIGVWAVGGALIGLTAAIVGNTQIASASSMVTLIIPGAAAALVGAFRRLDLAVVGGLLVGGVQGVLTAFPQITALRNWIPIVVIVLVLLWSQRKEVWDVAR